jgi:tRNA(Ile)-lysidine synthase TilS/MesJ
LFRPLLSVWRNEIDDYVTTQEIRFREDVTNESLVPLRNRVRRKVIPFLEKQFDRPDPQKHLASGKHRIGGRSFFEELLPSNLTRSTELAVKPLREMPLAVQRRMLHEWLDAGNISGGELRSD